MTIPANTAQASPVTVNTAFPSMEVERIVVKVPPGPSGLMGFALTMNGQQVIPINDGAWIIADNDTLDWPLTSLPNTGQWQVTGYNTDIYDHSIYIDFLLSPLGVNAAQQQAAANAQTASVLAMTGGT